MIRITNFVNRFKDIIFLFLLSLTPLVWYGTGNKLIASHDVGYPLNPLEVFKTRIFAWTSSVDFGTSQIPYSGTVFYHGLEALFTFLFGSVFTGQKIYVILWFFLPMLVMYLVLKRIKPLADKPYLCLLSAVLLQFNHFQMQGWGVFWQARFSDYILLPLVLMLMTEYFDGKRGILRTGVLFGLFVFFLNGGGSPPVFGSLLIMMMGLIAYYLILALPKKLWPQIQRTVLFLAIAGVFGFLISAFWTIPYFYFSFLSYGNIISGMGGPTAVLGWADAVSANASVLNLLRLQGISNWILPYAPFYAKIFLTNPVFVAAGFLWPVLAFSSLIFARKQEEKKYILLFAFLALIAVVFSAGSHEPFRSFYIFSLKNIPAFPMFRTPFYKFANLLWFSYAVLAGFTLSSIIEKTGFIARLRQLSFQKVSRILAVCFLLGIFIWDHPHITGVFFNYGRDVGLTTMEKIPNYVFRAGRFFDSINDWKNRTFVVPEVNQLWTVEIYKWGYFSGTTVNSFLTRKDFVSNDGSMLGIKDEQTIVNGLYELLREGDSRCFDIMKMLGIDSVLLHNDSYYDLPNAPSTNPSIYKQTLNKASELKKTISIGQWEYYQLQKPTAGKIFIPQNTLYSAFDAENSLNLLLFLQSIDIDIADEFIYLPEQAKKITGGLNDPLVIMPLPKTYLLPEEQQEFSLFQPKVLPNSPFYFLVTAREKELEQKTSGPKKLADLYLGFSLKRLAELNGLLKTQADLQDEKNVLDKYGQALGDARKQIDLFANQADKEEAMMRGGEFIARERNFLAQTINKEKNPFIKSALENSYKMSGDIMRSLSLEPENNILELEKDYNDPSVIVLTSRYQWEVPEAGSYEIYLNNTSVLANAQELLINIDGKTVNSKQTTVNREQEIDNASGAPGWQKIGEIELTKGQHGLKITADGIPIYSFKKGDLVFYKRDNSKQITVNSKQKISYTRLNPTRYKVEVSSSGQPLTLVFNERFDKDWKIYVKDVRDKTYDLSKNSQGGIISDILSLKSYILNLLDENIFNTLKLKPLDEKYHFKANGYANAWYIDNAKCKNQNAKSTGNECEIIIDYWPQRLLWLGYLVSAATVLASFGYLVVKRKKE